MPSAIQDFEFIPPGSAERAEAQYHIGEAYQNLHQDDQAKAAYQKLLSIGPRDNEFRIAGLLELAKIIEGKGSTEGSSDGLFRHRRVQQEPTNCAGRAAKIEGA